jgi:4-hydroxy-4-methyl-2-oxoglutarate aldolase
LIEEPPLLEIAKRFERPAETSVAAFRETPTSFVVDAMGGLGAMDWRIKSIGNAGSFAGVALTCHCGPADNLALCAAAAQCGPGDVLVAATDQFTGSSVAGDLLLGIAKNRGAAALVTDGLIRDLSEIEALGLPCCAMGASPNSPARNGPGTVGLPVICGGVLVRSGDIVVGDRDGVVVVPRLEIDQVLAQLGAVRKAEAEMLARVKAGLKEIGHLSVIPPNRIRYIDLSGAKR